MTARYANPFTRRNYDDAHNPPDTFAHTCALKYPDISGVRGAKLVAALSIREGGGGEEEEGGGAGVNVSDTIQLFRHLGKPLIFQTYQTYRPAGRATRFKLPVIVFRRLECHVLIGCIFNYPPAQPRRVTSTRSRAPFPSRPFHARARGGGSVWEIKVDRWERSASMAHYFRRGRR